MVQLVEDCLEPLVAGSSRDVALDTLVCVEHGRLQSLLQPRKVSAAEEEHEQEADAQQERMCLLRKTPALSYNVAFEHVDNLRQQVASAGRSKEAAQEWSDLSDAQMSCSNLFSLGFHGSDDSRDGSPMAASPGAGVDTCDGNQDEPASVEGTSEAAQLVQGEVLPERGEDFPEQRAVDAAMMSEASPASDRLASLMNRFETNFSDRAPALPSSTAQDGTASHKMQTTCGIVLEGSESSSVKGGADVGGDGKERRGGFGRRLKSGDSLSPWTSEPTPPSRVIPHNDKDVIPLSRSVSPSVRRCSSKINP